MTTRPTIVVCEGDQTGQELLDPALRALEPSVLGFERSISGAMLPRATW